MDDMIETLPAYSESDLNRIGRLWLDRVKSAEDREANWIKDAEGAEAAYLCDSESNDLPDFNILHSNVETIVPAIFNSSPKPEIRPRHNAEDSVGKVVSDIYERAISTQVDDNALDEEIEATAQDCFVAGRGVTRIKFDADDAEMIDPVSGDVVGETVTNERVIYENVSWRDYREGPAKRWKGVPWVAFRHEISEEEKERLENTDITAAYKRKENAEKEELEHTVWEVWCKETRRVYFVLDDSAKVLDIQEDPLGLSGFFPMPKPIQPIVPTGKRTPTCPYSVYKTLAEELDLATQRINKIMKGLKVRGLIAADARGLEDLADAGDNDIVPVQNIENLVAAGGLDKAIMWWPVDKAIAVLQQLYIQRDQIKQAIYELTGISDIVRGASSAAETATAQQIKTQWGSLRIKKMQRMIERHARDIFVLTAEIMGLHFTLETLQKASGMQIPPEAANIVSEPLNNYRIDIESDSTVRADLTKSRTEMSEFLNGTAQFFSAMAPVVQSAPQSAEPLARMYAAFARQFNLGKDAEDALDQFTEMAKQAAKGAQNKSDPEAERARAEMQMKMQEFQAKMSLEVEKLKLQAQNLGLDGEIKRAELALRQAELGVKRDELDLKESVSEFDAFAKVAEIELEDEQQRPVAVG